MKKVLLSVLILGICIFANAQKLKGDLSPLAGQQKINVVFVYDGVTYDGDSEAKFFKDNSDKDDFEQWKTNWTTSFRTDMWEPEFFEQWNEEFDGKKLKAGRYADAAYTATVKITDIDPGNFAGPFSNPCKLTATVSFAKTGDSTPFATIEFKELAGGAYQMTPIVEHRVKFAFDELGETVGEILKKKVK